MFFSPFFFSFFKGKTRPDPQGAEGKARPGLQGKERATPDPRGLDVFFFKISNRLLFFFYFLFVVPFSILSFCFFVFFLFFFLNFSFLFNVRPGHRNFRFNIKIFPLKALNSPKNVQMFKS